MSDSLLALILEEQKRTNELLLMLIEAMADESGEPEGESGPVTYMDGSVIG